VAWVTARPSPAVSMPPDTLCTMAAWFVGERGATPAAAPHRLATEEQGQGVGGGGERQHQAQPRFRHAQEAIVARLLRTCAPTPTSYSMAVMLSRRCFRGDGRGNQG
jgi:hypothetical protein